MDEQTSTPPQSSPLSQEKPSPPTPPPSTTTPPPPSSDGPPPQAPQPTKQQTPPNSDEPPPAGTKNIAQMAADILDKLPPLPENWKAIFIKWYPWILIIGALLALPWVLTALGLAPVASVFTLGGLEALAPGVKGTGLMLIISIVNIVISLIGGFQMRNMKKTGWNLAMISEGLDILSTLSSRSTLGLLFSLIIIYFLWQVKDRYN